MIERLQSSRDALDESVRAQRQLVADASHELRTPITSLRTNIEVLLAGDALAEEDRHRLLADVLEQSEELSALIGDVIELARGDLPITSAEDVRLDRVVADVVTRARRDFPQIRFESSLEPVAVDGVPERLARAVNNLLDNAAHHSAAGGVVEVDRRSARPERARPRHRHRPGRPAVRVRPVLPRRQLPPPAGQRPRSRDRPPGGGAARRVRRGGQRSRRRRLVHPAAADRGRGSTRSARRAAPGRAAIRSRFGRGRLQLLRAGDSRLAGEQEALAQELRADREHDRDGHQQQRPEPPASRPSARSRTPPPPLGSPRAGRCASGSPRSARAWSPRSRRTGR